MARLEIPRGRLRTVAGLLAALVAACTLVNPLDRYQAGKDVPDAQPPGEPDTGPGAVVDGGPNDAGPSWKRYGFSFADMTWSKPVPLAELWSSPNAPPPRGIVTAVELVDFDRLIVFAGDGKAYLQADGAWRPPVAIATAWSPLTAAPRAAFHVPYAFLRTVAPDAGEVEGITMLDDPNVFVFHYTKDDVIGFDEAKLLDHGDGGPPASAHSEWSFEVLDLENADPAQRYKNVTLYDDGSLVEFWADFSLHTQPVGESVLWKGKVDAPSPMTITAAYFHQVTRTAYFVGP